jgi:hypothetical protein
VELDQALAVLAAFERRAVRYVLVGSMALAAQGIIRATRDIEVFVAPHPDNVEGLKEALKDLFDDPEIDTICAEGLAGEYPAV